MLAGPLWLVAVVIFGFAVAGTDDGLEIWDAFFFLGFECSVIFAIFGVRRMHDLGRSGWWLVLVVLPFLLAYFPPLFPFLYLHPLVALVLFGMCAFFPGQDKVNRHGPPGSGSPFEIERFEGRESV